MGDREAAVEAEEAQEAPAERQSWPLRCRFIAAAAVGSQIMLDTLERRVNDFFDSMGDSIELEHVVAVPPIGVLLFYRLYTREQRALVGN